MGTTRAFAARALSPWERPQALELARDCGVNGIYVANWLASRPVGADGPERPERDQDSAELQALWGEHALLGLCFFGGRGNLVVLEREELAPAAVAHAVQRSLWGWRIVLARAPIVAALADRESVRPLVRREQVWYGVEPERVPAELLRDDVRAAAVDDVSALMDAALQLNHSDLHVEPRRVNRAWLQSMIEQRIAEGTTRCLGEPGRLSSKLDLGSTGAFGVVLEGVYTRPAARGQGFAKRLVATVSARDAAGSGLSCLHVAADNAAARRAYESAGMRELGRCWLMLRG